MSSIAPEAWRSTTPCRCGRELNVSLEQLPPDARFGVVFYNLNATTMTDENEKPGLMPATAANKERVRTRLLTLRAEGPTDHAGALEAAFAMHPEVIFFLTDGRQLRPKRPINCWTTPAKSACTRRNSATGPTQERLIRSRPSALALAARTAIWICRSLKHRRPTRRALPQTLQYTRIESRRLACEKEASSRTGRRWHGPIDDSLFRRNLRPGSPLRAGQVRGAQRLSLVRGARVDHARPGRPHGVPHQSGVAYRRAAGDVTTRIAAGPRLDLAVVDLYLALRLPKSIAVGLFVLPGSAHSACRRSANWPARR